MSTIKLLNIDSNAKTVKGQKKGYMTAILYLTPHTYGAIDDTEKTLCAQAISAGCGQTCLSTAGRGGIAAKGDVISTPAGDIPNNSVQIARLRRTRLFREQPIVFMGQLVDEIRRFIMKAERKGLIPVVRLNGTSDIMWEYIRDDQGRTLFDIFPNVQFYDYTKIYARASRDLPSNYHLTVSYSEATPRFARQSLKASIATGVNLAVVFRGNAPKSFQGLPVINGDESDLRFLDPANGTHIVALKAKGRARQDQSGFVIDPDQSLIAVAI